MPWSESPDVLIAGSGIGGATLAHALAPSGARILILERGERLRPTPLARDLGAVFGRGHFRSGEHWFDGAGRAFAPGTYYVVGGASKVYGAVMYRYRASDFAARPTPDGETVAWPFGYDALEPYYAEAEALFGVRGQAGADPTEPPRSSAFPHPPVPHEPQVADAAERLARQGLHPSALPLSVDLDAWMAGGRTPWDGLPNTGQGKVDAETGPLARALAHPNVTLVTGACVEALEMDGAGARVAAARVRHGGEARRVTAGTYVLAAGAVQSAALLLRSDRRGSGRSGEGGVANASGMVGRHYMNHNTTAMIAMDPRRRWGTVHSKTLALNDFYLADEATGAALGNVQLLGKISAPVLAANLPVRMPRRALEAFCARSLDWLLMTEDLARPESRVRVDGARIVLDWARSNMAAHAMLIARMRRVFRAAGYPVVLTKAFGDATPSHQCGTIRMGTDPARFPLDPWCASHDHDNLRVVDASCLPSAAAVNPSLTIAALALRVGARMAGLTSSR